MLSTKDTINQNLIVKDVLGNESLVLKVLIRGFFDNTYSPRFTALPQILNNYALGIFRLGKNSHF